MMKVRPVERRDLADIFELAGKTGVGMTSLPQMSNISPLG